jgi:hypothetical protein
MYTNTKRNRKKYDYIDDNYTLAEIDVEERYDEKQALARYRQLVENRKKTNTISCDNLLYFLN